MQGHSTGRKPLSTRTIVDAAITVIERDGGNALTMRKVAAELGVGVMSLYGHVPDRDSLIESVAQAVLACLDEAAVSGPHQDWKASALALAEAFQAGARRYPRSTYLVLTSSLDVSLAWAAAERALALLETAGFDAHTSVRVLRTIMSYLIGSQLMEHGALLMSDDPQDAIRVVQAAPHEYPRSIALGRELLHPDPHADFKFGLELLLIALDKLPRTPKS